MDRRIKTGRAAQVWFIFSVMFEIPQVCILDPLLFTMKEEPSLMSVCRPVVQTFLHRLLNCQFYILSGRNCPIRVNIYVAQCQFWLLILRRCVFIEFYPIISELSVCLELIHLQRQEGCLCLQPVSNMMHIL